VTNGDRAILRAFERPNTRALYAFVAFGEWSIGWDASDTSSRAAAPPDAELLEGLSNGDTLLHIAARQDHTSVLELLLQLGAEPSMCNALGQTAEDVATTTGAVSLIQGEQLSGAPRMLSSLGVEIEDIIKAPAAPHASV
jgi:hypothetical protein